MKTTCTIFSLPFSVLRGLQNNGPELRLCGLLLLLGWPGPAAAQGPGTGPGAAAKAAVPDSLQPASATSPTRQRNALKINPLSLAAGQLSAFYERALTKQISVVAGYGVGGNKANFGRQLENGGCTYQRVTVELRRYWKKQALAGFYVGPYLRLTQLRESYFEELPPSQRVNGSWRTRQALIWVPGVLAGHQLLTKRFVLDSFVGLQAQLVAGTLQSSNQVVEGMTSALALRVGVAVGMPF